MGGRRLAPGQAVDALDEAIDDHPRVWDADERGGVRVDGEHYQVDGAQARSGAGARRRASGSAPTSRGCCALTGRAADGWLPSLGYLRARRPGRDERVIDEAARAGRARPRPIRRLLNVIGSVRRRPAGLAAGPAEQWAEELAELALDDGHQRLHPRQPTTLTTCGGSPHEVAPAVRELVAAERAAAPRTQRPRRAAARASRRSAASAGDGARSPSRRRPTTATRLSAELLWDESTRPAGPAPRPGRVPTPRGSRPPASTSSTSTTACAPSSTSCATSSSRSRAGTLDAGAARSYINTDDDAAEQLDARHLLRVLLPHGDQAPHASRTERLPAPAPRRPAARRR